MFDYWYWWSSWQPLLFANDNGRLPQWGSSLSGAVVIWIFRFFTDSRNGFNICFDKQKRSAQHDNLRHKRQTLNQWKGRNLNWKWRPGAIWRLNPDALLSLPVCVCVCVCTSWINHHIRTPHTSAGNLKIKSAAVLALLGDPLLKWMGLSYLYVSTTHTHTHTHTSGATAASFDTAASDK